MKKHPFSLIGGLPHVSSSCHSTFSTHAVGSGFEACIFIFFHLICYQIIKLLAISSSICSRSQNRDRNAGGGRGGGVYNSNPLSMASQPQWRQQQQQQQKPLLKPSTSKAQPQPSTSGTLLQPSTSRTHPQPSTSRTQPQPSTSRILLQPSTSGTQPQPSTSGTQPQPSTSKTQPETCPFISEEKDQKPSLTVQQLQEHLAQAQKQTALLMRSYSSLLRHFRPKQTVSATNAPRSRSESSTSKMEMKSADFSKFYYNYYL